MTSTAAMCAGRLGITIGDSAATPTRYRLQPGARRGSATARLSRTGRFHFPDDPAQVAVLQLLRAVEVAGQARELLGPVSVLLAVRIHGHENPGVGRLPDHLVVIEQFFEQPFAGTQAGDVDRHVPSGSQAVLTDQ